MHVNSSKHNKRLDFTDYVDSLIEMAFMFEKDEVAQERMPMMVDMYERPADVELLQQQHQSRYSCCCIDMLYAVIEI